ncbi:MAG: 16S rRNA processing protein RimM [Bacteroidetes bacterium GWF2_40_14]|nr:MAG: 16S rRNA processing protein RimM [Bacteroidetes bacterium GWF2_40_14]
MQKSANILLPVAKVLKSFGTKGEMVIRYSPETQEDIDKKKPVFIYYDGLPVPFFVESIQNRATDQALLKLEGIYSESLANEIVGELIYLEKKSKKAGTKITGPKDLIGYLIVDNNGTTLGEVVSYYDYPNNPCLGVKMADRESQEQLLPLIDEFILDISQKNKTLTVSVAKGLLEL